jgi:hypothetical protein
MLNEKWGWKDWVFTIFLVALTIGLWYYIFKAINSI